MIDFKLPSLGADMDEGTLLEWKVKPGDTVKKGQVVAVVDTAKAAIDVECWQEGTVAELLARPGEKMPVGTVIARLIAPEESAHPQPSAGEAAALAAPRAEATTTPSPAVETMQKIGAGETAPRPGERHRISPAAKKRASELGIDVERLAGSGPQGAVTLEDVEKAAAARPSASQPAADRAQAMRQTIAAAMSRSKREIPHYYVSEDIPLARMLAWLQETNAQRPMSERLLPAAVLLKAVARALADYPELNGHYLDGVFQPAKAVHLGVAISLRGGGLVAPALLDADGKPLTQLMQE
ncbi:MAG: dihydrolipoamide acetyltransferase family protein, partial [Rhodocyclaceae bacterium]